MRNWQRRGGKACRTLVPPTVSAMVIARTAVVSPGVAGPEPQRGLGHGVTSEFEVNVFSTRPDTVSGGTALVRIKAPRTVPIDRFDVTLNGGDVRGAFKSSGDDRTLIGLLDGLALGEHELRPDAPGQGRGRRNASLPLVNHPATGAILDDA
jgi:hypothetical protein